MIEVCKLLLKKTAIAFCLVLTAAAESYSQDFSAGQLLFDSAGRQWIFVDSDNVYRYDTAGSGSFSRLYGIPGYRTVVPSASGKLVFLHGSRHIADQQKTDSITQADNILHVAFANDQPAFAIITNDSLPYFARKKSDTWVVSPVMFTTQRPKSKLEIYFWILLITLPVMTILLVARNLLVNRRIKAIIDQNSVENPLLTKSEKPIGLKDEDLLGFDALEDAILSIIRNPQTELPMSIVISGDWGSGKSSMMNRMREKLETDDATKNRFMTSWFNAWHFQTENRLLDAFLLNIIDSYNRNYKGFFDAFRLRLWLQRFQKQSAGKKFIFGFALAAALPFLLSIIKFLLSKWSKTFKGFELQFLDSYESILYNLFVNKSFFSAESIPTVGAGVIAVASAIFLNRQLMPQGINSLMSLIPRTNAKLEVEKRQAGYREEFKKEYWEIVDAGEGTKRLVVFIDDIDRISGEKVLELLEAINFISDVASKAPGSKSRAPNTIFVLGMFAKEVTKNLGTRLNELNNVDNHVKDPQVIGALYIEKMVQLIVPIPFDGSKLKQLL